MSKFDQSNQFVKNQSNAARDIHNIINNHIPSPVETIKAAYSTASKCFQMMLPKGHNHSRTVQFDAEHHRSLERIASERLELAKIDLSHRADAENRLIQLKKEEVELLKEKLKWEKLVAQENFKLIRSSNAIAIKSLELKQEELQTGKDMHYLPLQATRDDIIQIFSQDNGKFIIIPSDPEILREDIQAFKSLKAEIPNKLEHTIERYYGKARGKTAIGNRNIFNKSIKETSALVVGKFIAPIPTLIFHSQVTHHNVLISMTLTCPAFKTKTVTSQAKPSEPQFTVDINQETFSLPSWNWMDIKKELELQDQDHDDISQTILDLIVNIHLMVALYFCDLYCLNLDPKHSPKLFEFLKEPDLPHSLQTWAKPLESSLEKTQKKIINRVKKELDKIRVLEAENIRYSYGGSDTDLGDFIPAIVSGIGLMFLLAMCNQKFPNVYKSNTSIQNSIEQQQGRTGIIRVNRPDANSAGLRVVPEQDGEVIDMLPNGTPVVSGKVSSNGLWQKVIAKDGKSGWVWAEFIQK